MKRLLILSMLLVACTAGTNGPPADASQSEINMAEFMGITIEELRDQTPEEHMKMMMEKSNGETGMKQAAPDDAKCGKSGCSCNIAQAPDAPKKGGCGCGKKSCNKA